MGEKRRRSALVEEGLREEDEAEVKRKKKEKNGGEEKIEKKKRRSKVAEEETPVNGVKDEEDEEAEMTKEKKKKRKSKQNEEKPTSNEMNGGDEDAVDIFSEVAAAETVAVLEGGLLERLRCHLIDSKDHEASLAEVHSRASSLPFLSSLLSAYTATRTPTDLAIYELLVLLERVYGVNVGALSPLVFGERARANYESLRRLGKFLHVKQTPDQVLHCLNSEQLWKTALQGDKEGVLPANEVYDLRFVLRLLISITHPASELSCRVFAERGCLALAFCSSSSQDSDTRRLGLFLLQRYLALLQELKADDFIEKSLFIYLIRLFKNSLETEAPRISHMVTHFLARVSRLLLSPTHPLFAPILAFLTLKPTLELNQVPELFKLLLSSSTEHHEDEQEWILELMGSALIDSHDYAVLENRSGLRLVTAHFGSTMPTMKTKRASLALFKSIARIPSVALDAMCRQSLAGWIAATIQRPSLTRWETIYLGEIYSILLEKAREHVIVGGAKETRGRLASTLAIITAPTVCRALAAGPEVASSKLKAEIQECLKRDWGLEERKTELESSSSE